MHMVNLDYSERIFYESETSLEANVELYKKSSSITTKTWSRHIKTI